MRVPRSDATHGSYDVRPTPPPVRSCSMSSAVELTASAGLDLASTVALLTPRRPRALMRPTVAQHPASPILSTRARCRAPIREREHGGG